MIIRCLVQIVLALHSLGLGLSVSIDSRLYTYSFTVIDYKETYRFRSTYHKVIFKYIILVTMSLY